MYAFILSVKHIYKYNVVETRLSFEERYENKYRLLTAISTSTEKYVVYHFFGSMI